jgi:hypothetical protein
MLRGALEGDKPVTYLIAVEPGPKAQLTLKADPWFAGAWKGKVPASKRLIMLLTDEIWSDVYMVYKLKRGFSPDALLVPRGRRKAEKPLKAANNGQIGMLLELLQHTIKSASFARYDVVVLDEADDFRRSKPDSSVEHSYFMEVVWED